MKLSKTKIKQIERWLRRLKDKANICPFYADTAYNWCVRGRAIYKICRNTFPKTVGKSCPCREYTLPYVIKKAKQMVKTGEV